jgi:putative tricarboxylic transport membrane protein
MIVFRVIGFFTDRYEFPTPPVILRTILGKMLKTCFVMTFMKGGIIAFFNRPLSLVLIMLIIFIILTPKLGKVVIGKR